MITRIASMILAIFTVLFSPLALAESLEDFLKRGLLNDINERMYHPEGRYMLLVGNQEVVLSRGQALQAARQLRSMGSKVELLDFKILNKHETGDIVSAVVRAKVRQSMGSTQAIGETVSHELLIRKNGSYVSVFSIGRQ